MMAGMRQHALSSLIRKRDTTISPSSSLIVKCNHTMASRGTSETSKLHSNLQEQLDRLLDQLQDLEECREDLEEEEYEVTKRETEEQLSELRMTLKKLESGNMTLIDSQNEMQLAIQSAIAAAFKTPEVLAMFARKQPDQLRLKLAQVERDHKIKLLPSESFQQQKLEILMALKKLKEPISEAEQQFLQANSSQSMKEFEQVPDQSLDQLVLSSLDAV